MDQYEQECVNKIVNKQKLYQDELRDIANIFIVELIPDGIIYKNNDRYFKVKNIVKLNDKFFEIDFTYKCKNFEDKRWGQPIEVEKKKVEKIIIVDEWIPKK